jgi:hypothetical protein
MITWKEALFMKKNIPAKWQRIWETSPAFARARLMALHPDVEWPPDAPVGDVFGFGSPLRPDAARRGSDRNREITLDIPYTREVSGHVHWSRTDSGTDSITVTADEVEDCTCIDDRGNRVVDHYAVRRLVNSRAADMDYDDEGETGEEEIDWDGSDTDDYGDVDIDTRDACESLKEWIEENMEEFFPDDDDDDDDDDDNDNDNDNES